MKFQINKLNLNIAITSGSLLILLTINFPTLALAMPGDTKMPIHIESEEQFFNMRSNVVTFNNNVTITQGTIKINAKKVVITTTYNGKDGKEIIDGYGSPITFSQIQDNGKPIKGRSLHMRYEPDKDLVILNGNVYLEQMNNSITSNKIIYFVKTQKIQACSGKGNRVITKLIPSQFQDTKQLNFNAEKNSD